MQKCYSVSVTGKVQDVSFRSVVEHAGRELDITGLVFNAKDGSVKIICCCEDRVIDEFFDEIRIRGEQRGAVIKDIERQEIPFVIELPDRFTRVLTDEDIDIGRKLDKGNDLLIDIKSDTSGIKKDTSDIKSDTSGIKKDTSTLPAINTGIDNLNNKFGSFTTHLEKILEKLAER